MAKPSAESPPPHEFPSWPFGFTDFYSHAARDYGRCVEAMTKATDTAQTMRAEGDYGFALWRDMMHAYYDFALLPVTVMAKAAVAAQQADGEKAPGVERPTAAE